VSYDGISTSSDEEDIEDEAAKMEEGNSAVRARSVRKEDIFSSDEEAESLEEEVTPAVPPAAALPKLIHRALRGLLHLPKESNPSEESADERKKAEDDAIFSPDETPAAVNQKEAEAADALKETVADSALKLDFEDEAAKMEEGNSASQGDGVDEASIKRKMKELYHFNKTKDNEIATLNNEIATLKRQLQNAEDERRLGGNEYDEMIRQHPGITWMDGDTDLPQVPDANGIPE
jgi:hypothetical protein